jgi:hypothetical protein
MNCISYEKIRITAFNERRIKYKTSFWRRTTIDFSTCNNNWKNQNKKKIEVMGEGFAHRMTGYRNAFESPSYVELCTEPVTRFEFPSRSEYDKFRQLMEKSGWDTFDRG